MKKTIISIIALTAITAQASLTEREMSRIIIGANDCATMAQNAQIVGTRVRAMHAATTQEERAAAVTQYFQLFRSPQLTEILSSHLIEPYPREYLIKRDCHPIIAALPQAPGDSAIRRDVMAFLGQYAKSTLRLHSIRKDFPSGW